MALQTPVRKLRLLPQRSKRGDTLMQLATTSAAAVITATVLAIGVFLLWRAIPALSKNEGGLLGFITYTGTWDTAAMRFGIPNLLAVTVIVSIIALVIAMPISLGVALYLSCFAPRQLSRPLAFLVDMLAAIPSIVFGLWGWQVLGPTLGRFYELIHTKNIPLLATYPNSPSFDTSRNIFTGGIVLGIMIIPIISATAREVFSKTPAGQIEAALALGATRWEVVRMTVLPYGKSGFIAGSMLGLGRALGETMALYMVMSPSSAFRFSLFDGGSTFATTIANAAPEFNDNIKAGAYIAAGLVLFLLTFVVNAAARKVIR